MRVEVYTKLACAEDTARQGCDQSAAQGRNRGRFSSRPCIAILAESDKSREREGSALAVREAFFPYDAGAVLVRQLRGPHLSTWP